jgi:hypothetical protein
MSTKKMWKNLDQDGSGAIDEREFNESLREYYGSDPNQKTFNVASNNSKVQILYDPYNTAKSDLIHRKQIGGGSDDAQKPGSRGGGKEKQHGKQRSSRDPLHALLSNSRTSLTNTTYGQFSEHSKHWDMQRAELLAKTRPHTVASPGRRSSRGSRRSKGSSGDSFFERGSTRPASSTGTAGRGCGTVITPRLAPWGIDMDASRWQSRMKAPPAPRDRAVRAVGCQCRHVRPQHRAQARGPRHKLPMERRIVEREATLPNAGAWVPL